MPTITHKITHASLVEIKLYKEGVFWVAYEQSAYYIAQLKGYKPTKKYFKNIQKEVVQVGFPKIENVLNTKNIKVITQQNVFVCLTIETV